MLSVRKLSVRNIGQGVLAAACACVWAAPAAAQDTAEVTVQETEETTVQQVGEATVETTVTETTVVRNEAPVDRYAQHEVHRELSYSDPGYYSPADRPRLRIGLELGGGGAFGDVEGDAFAAIGQLGAQMNDWFGLYYQPTLHLSGWIKDDQDKASEVLGMSHGVMLMFSLGRFFEIGGGGSYFYGHVDECASLSQDCELDGFHAGAINGRVAFVIGFDRPNGGRIGIPISLNSQTALNGDEHITTLIAAIGLQRF